MPQINIYTDGSCFPKEKQGTWAAIIIIEKQETIIKGQECDTNHNRMELTAAIKALDYILVNKIKFSSLNLYSDSQYLVNIPERKSRLLSNDFITKKGKKIQNYDLVEMLLNQIQHYQVNFLKVKAHQKQGIEKNYNRVVDKIVRADLRAIKFP